MTYTIYHFIHLYYYILIEVKFNTVKHPYNGHSIGRTFHYNGK